jgi:hypothetical protein
MRHIDIGGHIDIPYKKVGITGAGTHFLDADGGMTGCGEQVIGLAPTQTLVISQAQHDIPTGQGLTIFKEAEMLDGRIQFQRHVFLAELAHLSPVTQQTPERSF